MLSGFQLIPRITRIVPPRAYPEDRVAIIGDGFLPNAVVFTANDMKMQPVASGNGRSEPDSERLTVLVPTGGQSGKITVKQGIGQGRSSTSAEELTIDRIEDVLKRGDWVAEAELKIGRDRIILRTSCSQQKLLISGDIKDVPPVAVGFCPVDVDVDPVQHLAYTANARSNDISRIDLTNPLIPKALPNISSGGSNPRRIKVLRDGRAYVGTDQGVFESKPGGEFQRTEIQEGIIEMLSDSSEQSWVAIITSTGQAYIARREVQGFVRIPVGDNPKSATQAGNKIYVANYGSDDVAVLDANSGRQLAKISVPKAKPIDITIDPKHSLGLVAESALGFVGVINTIQDRLTQEVKVGEGSKPELVAITENGCLAAVYDSQEKAIWRINLLNTNELTAKKIRQLPASSPEIGRIRFNESLREGEYDLYLLLPQGGEADQFTLACPLRN